MPKNHAKKNAGRRRQQATGAAYTSATTGTEHHHGGPTLEPVDGRPYGTDRQADMAAASALIGACVQACQPCQRSLTEKVLEGDRLVIAELASVAYKLLPSPGIVASPMTRTFHPLAVAAHTSGDARLVLAFVEGLDVLPLEDLLNDTLDMWVAAEVLLGDDDPADTDAWGEDGDQDGDPVRLTEGAWACAFVTSAGMDQYVTAEEMRLLVELGEASTTGGDPIICFLCDESIDVTAGAEVHIGLALFTNEHEGEPDACVPVWTHEHCGHARIWTSMALDAERHRRGLPTHRPQPDDNPRSDAAGEPAADYTLFSLAQLSDAGPTPLVVIQPGRPHEHGVAGHLADLVSQGLQPVDLSGQQPPAELPAWQLRTERGRLTAVTRSGAGAWYRQDGGHPTPGEWRQAARKKRAALVLVVPAGTFPDDGTDHRAELAAAAAAGHVLGGLMSIRGTMS